LGRIAQFLYHRHDADTLRRRIFGTTPRAEKKSSLKILLSIYIKYFRKEVKKRQEKKEEREKKNLKQKRVMSSTSCGYQGSLMECPPTGMFAMPSGNFMVQGAVNFAHAGSTLVFWAANPMTPTGSAAGAGMPFPTPDIAYDNTVNRGSVLIGPAGQFQFMIRFPNAYYTQGGAIKVEPCVHYRICGPGSDNQIHTITLGNAVPYRSQTYPTARKGPEFYASRLHLPLRSQEEILRASGYPSTNISTAGQPAHFWRGAVPSA
jgi:hypothetical protein